MKARLAINLWLQREQSVCVQPWVNRNGISVCNRIHLHAYRRYRFLFDLHRHRSKKQKLREHRWSAVKVHWASITSVSLTSRKMILMKCQHRFLAVDRVSKDWNNYFRESHHSTSAIQRPKNLIAPIILWIPIPTNSHLRRRSTPQQQQQQQQLEVHLYSHPLARWSIIIAVRLFKKSHLFPHRPLPWVKSRSFAARKPLIGMYEHLLSLNRSTNIKKMCRGD